MITRIEPNARERVIAQEFFRDLKPGDNWSEAFAVMLAEYREEVLDGFKGARLKRGGGV